MKKIIFCAMLSLSFIFGKVAYADVEVQGNMLTDLEYEELLASIPE